MFVFNTLHTTAQSIFCFEKEKTIFDARINHEIIIPGYDKSLVIKYLDHVNQCHEILQSVSQI